MTSKGIHQKAVHGGKSLTPPSTFFPTPSFLPPPSLSPVVPCEESAVDIMWQESGCPKVTLFTWNGQAALYTQVRVTGTG